MKDELVKVLSLGAGVQSTALLLMSIRGELPKLDYAIFADTGWEPKEVYDHLDWCFEQGEAAGIKMVKVSGGNLREQAVGAIDDTSKRFASIPCFIKNPDGSVGMGRRQCTREFKIDPIEKYQRKEILKLKPRQHAPKEYKIEQWIGITRDEVVRAKDSMVKWKLHAFPFVDIPIGLGYLDKMWRRTDCISWLEENVPDRYIPRSACVGCPYHNNAEWRRIRENEEEWRDAVEFDRKIREPGRGMAGKQYLHRDAVPLDQVDLRTDLEKGQPDLWGNECEGMCGM